MTSPRTDKPAPESLTLNKAANGFLLCDPSQGSRQALIPTGSMHVFETHDALFAHLRDLYPVAEGTPRIMPQRFDDSMFVIENQRKALDNLKDQIDDEVKRTQTYRVRVTKLEELLHRVMNYADQKRQYLNDHAEYDYAVFFVDLNTMALEGFRQ